MEDSKVEEVWKDIKIAGYQVSSLGRLRNKNKYILAQSYTERGYLKISLFYNGSLHTHKVHRLVAAAFIENPNGLLTINHKDCNKANNVYTNLEWMSSKDNYDHGVNNGLMRHGESHPDAVLTDNDVHQIIGLIKEGLSDIEISKLYGVVHSCIYKIRVGLSWKHIERPVFNKTGHKKKLKAEGIPVIRKMFLDGVINADIAKIYNVDGGTISQIKQGRTWKNY